MLRYIISAILSSLPILCTAASADTLIMSLNEAIMLARRNSLDASVAVNELRTAYWQWRSFKANRLPELSFSGTIPSYTKNYSSYQLDDGSYTFVRNNYIGLNGKLSVNQIIPFTGGTLSLETSADYLRTLSGEGDGRFMSVPVALTLSQPVFGVNTFRWENKIEPIRYREAQAAFLQASEEVAMTAISAYFQLLMADSDLNIARQNHDNSRRLYEVAEAKRRMGQISKNDLLQMELNLLEAESALTEAESALNEKMFSLRSFLDLDGNIRIIPALPAMVSAPEVDYADVLDKALERNKFSRNIRRRQLEADYEVAQAKGQLRQITLFARIGFTGTDSRFDGAYNRLRDNQVVELGVKIPLVDWGKRRGQVKVAQSNRDVVEARLRRESLDFKQDIFILTERFNNQKKQVELAAAADSIALRRYDANIQTYILGKISTLDLNDSQVKKDEARSEYIRQLYLYWFYYYQLRSLTLWDFEHSTGIDADFSGLISR